MKHNIAATLLLAGAGLLTSGAANAVKNIDFETTTTQNLINLCTVSKNDPKAAEAIHFCHGYLVGAFDYHMSEVEKDGKSPLFCLPTPQPSRNEAVAQFVKWALAHPEYMHELPVDTEFRFLSDQYPCKQ